MRQGNIKASCATLLPQFPYVSARSNWHTNQFNASPGSCDHWLHVSLLFPYAPTTAMGHVLLQPQPIKVQGEWSETEDCMQLVFLSVLTDKHISSLGCLLEINTYINMVYK